VTEYTFYKHMAQIGRQIN